MFAKTDEEEIRSEANLFSIMFLVIGGVSGIAFVIQVRYPIPELTECSQEKHTPVTPTFSFPLTKYLSSITLTLQPDSESDH